MSNEDRKIVIEKLREVGASGTSFKKLQTLLPDWSNDRICDAIDQLVGEKLLQGMGSSATHFSIDEDLLKTISLEPAPAPEPVPQTEPQSTPAPEPVPQPEPQPQHEPKKSKLSYLMAKIHAVKAPEILEGEAREARLCEIFEQCLNVVVEINEAITEIAAKFPMWVDPQKDLLQLIRVTPPEGSNAPGGIKLSYFPKTSKGFRKERFLLEEPWPKMLTSGGGGYIVKKVEREAVALVERMTNFVLRQK